MASTAFGSAKISWPISGTSRTENIVHTAVWHRHQAVLASAFAISSMISRNTMGSTSSPPRADGSSRRNSRTSCRAATRLGGSLPFRSISSAAAPTRGTIWRAARSAAGAPPAVAAACLSIMLFPRLPGDERRVHFGEQARLDNVFRTHWDRDALDAQRPVAQIGNAQPHRHGECGAVFVDVHDRGERIGIDTDLLAHHLERLRSVGRDQLGGT